MIDTMSQIAYVPLHAEGNIKHPDVEFGFVTSVHTDKGTAFCRFWRKEGKGLRTVANSELCDLTSLVEHKSRTENQVRKMFKKVYEDDEYATRHLNLDFVEEI